MDQDRFHKLILNRQEEVRAELSRIDSTTSSVELDQTRVGRLSRMDAIQQQQMGLELQRRLNRELSSLDAALSRLNDGEYGDCVHCGDAIDPRRLEIDLTATLCITCANNEVSR